MPSRRYIIGGSLSDPLRGGFCRGRSPMERHVRVYGLGRKSRYGTWIRSVARGFPAMARPQAGACGIGALRHLESHRSRNAVRCNGSGSSEQALCNWSLAAAEVIGCSSDRRIADGLGSATRLWLQHRRVCWWRCLGIAAWLAVVFGRIARLPGWHSIASAVRPVAGVADAYRLHRSGRAWRCSHFGRPLVEPFERPRPVA
jgi:hypothetical protein